MKHDYLPKIRQRTFYTVILVVLLGVFRSFFPRFFNAMVVAVVDFSWFIIVALDLDLFSVSVVLFSLLLLLVLFSLLLLLYLEHILRTLRIHIAQMLRSLFHSDKHESTIIMMHRHGEISDIAPI